MEQNLSQIIYAQHGFLQSVSQLVAGQKCVVVTDEIVCKIINSTAIESSLNCKVITLPHGEKAKNFTVLEWLICQFIEFELDRNSVVIAIGGGVVSDVAGLSASLYMRGISYINVPTTLLGMVDSAIGGKTAINCKLGKNIVGAFYQPKYVVMDFSFLKTLTENEINSGIGEIVKTCFLSKQLFEMLMLERQNLADNGVIGRFIASCASFKSQVVAVDERETLGERKKLNIGHTVGHMLEMCFNEHQHGHYVLEGLYYELMIAFKLGYQTEQFNSQALQLIEQFVPCPRYLDIEKSLQIASLDKKNSNGKICVMAVKEAGQVVSLMLDKNQFNSLIIQINNENLKRG